MNRARRRRNPFQGLVDHMSEMARMREYAEGGGQEDQQRTHATAWVPTTDIFAQGNDLVIRCELAGVEREDIDIEFSGGVLNISGERRSELNEEEVHFYTRERSFGHFRRRIKLPEGIDEDDISASFRDGMLQITVREGATAAEPRRIEIRDELG